MITGAHAIIYSKKSEADRAFLKDVLGLAHVDVGGGWLIFALPPSEVAIHPGPKDSVHQLYLLCDDVEAFRSMLDEKNVKSSAVKDQGWGLLTTVTLPGGGKLGVYQPRHPRPGDVPAVRAKSAKQPKKSAKKPAPVAAKKAAPDAAKTKRSVPAAKPKQAKPGRR